MSYSPLKDDVTNLGTDTYCIVLNIAEGIGFGSKDSFSNGIILNVSLNGVKFEVEGHFSQPNVIPFNSNCIWECELADLKRIKTDNRPVKLECFFNNDCYANGSTSHIGSLLLPLRGVKIINSLTNLKVKAYWYKLNNLSPNCRQNTPQLHLMLLVVKKSIVNRINLEAFLDNHTFSLTESNMDMLSANVNLTQNMLQSQQGIFIKLLEDVGQIQVGNDPLEDSDIVFITLTFRQIKSMLSLLNINQTSKEINKKSFVFQYDFLGSITNNDIVINKNDCFTINQKVSICFRSSLKSLRLYLQRVFYIPINVYYMSEVAIAKFNLDISSILPDDVEYFNEKGTNLWTKSDSFRLNILKKTSPRSIQPSVDFLLTCELITDAKEKQCDISPCTQQLIYTARHEDMISQEIKFEKESFVVESKVAEYLTLQQSVLEERALKPFYSEAWHEGETNRVPIKYFREIAVNTDDQFETQETQKKQIYMQDLQAIWEDQKSLLVASLEAKIMKCDQLLSQLENTQAQLNDIKTISLKSAAIANNISRDIESSYILKIKQLEKKIQCLTIKVNEQEIDKTVLKTRSDHLENQLEIYKSSHLVPDQLNDVLNEMGFSHQSTAYMQPRNQADRFLAIENFYKGQWLNCMHIVKINILKILDDRKISKNSDENIYLEEFFNEKINNLKANNYKSFQLSSISSFNVSPSDNEQFP